MKSVPKGPINNNAAVKLNKLCPGLQTILNIYLWLSVTKTELSILKPGDVSGQVTTGSGNGLCGPVLGLWLLINWYRCWLVGDWDVKNKLRWNSDEVQNKPFLKWIYKGIRVSELNHASIKVPKPINKSLTLIWLNSNSSKYVSIIVKTTINSMIWNLHGHTKTSLTYSNSLIADDSTAIIIS